MRVKKAKGNQSFRSHAEYVSHVDAYARTTAVPDKEELVQEDRRTKYAKLLEHKRLNDPSYKHHGAPKPPKQLKPATKSSATTRNQVVSSMVGPSYPSAKDTYYACRTNSSLNSRLDMLDPSATMSREQHLDDESEAIAATNFLNADLKYTRSSRANSRH